VFTNVLLADEINRATPKTQSALLEAMQEHSVTVAGTTYRLEQPYIVLATQNPSKWKALSAARSAARPLSVQDEGVFSQLEEMIRILDRTTTEASDNPSAWSMPAASWPCAAWCAKCPSRRTFRNTPCASCWALIPDSEYSTEQVRRFARYGSSPRGAQSLILAGKVRALLQGRFNVAYEDIEMVAHPALRHRIILNFEGQAEGIDTDD
jgi:MoxR-like ATPase